MTYRVKEEKTNSTPSQISKHKYYLKINFGCGKEKLKGYVNVDNDKGCNPDVLYDLNKFPYPFKTNSIEEIYSKFVVEHLENPQQFLRECYRILKPHKKITIVTDNMIGLHYILNKYKENGFDWFNEHICAFNRKMLERLFFNADFCLVKVDFVNDYPFRNYRIIPNLFCRIFKQFSRILRATATPCKTD